MTITRHIIFLSRQSRFAPARVGGFVWNNEHQKHLYLGRELTANEFNEACKIVFEAKRGIPAHASMSCRAIVTKTADQPKKPAKKTPEPSNRP